MRHLLILTMLALVGGCGGGKRHAEIESLMAPGNDFAPGFVDLNEDTDDDLDDLVGSELMVASAECGDLLKLEPSAMMGRLTEGEIRCLEEGYQNAERQTYKKKLSLILMADSWAKGEHHRWESIVRRHLQHVDQSNPNLAYKFALYLSRQGPEFAPETMKWVDRALENKSQFPSGDPFVNRVYGLHKLKAQAAVKHWAHLEEQYLEEPTQELKDQRDEARNQAKTLAREWLEYARNSGRDDTVAYKMCVSAAGTSQFCEQL